MRFFFLQCSPTKSLVTWKCQGERTLTGSSVNVNGEFQIKPKNITVKNYNLSVDINVDSTIFTDSVIRADYDSQRTVQQAMIQMKHSQISKERGKKEAQWEDCRLQILSDSVMILQYISISPGNEGLFVASQKEKHKNGNSDSTLSLVCFLIQCCDAQCFVKYFERRMISCNYRADG